MRFDLMFQDNQEISIQNTGYQMKNLKSVLAFQWMLAAEEACDSKEVLTK